MDEIDAREIMEASENAERPVLEGGSPALHRIDPDRATRALSFDSNAAGFARLNLMVNTIFGRFVEGGGESRT